MAVHMEMLDSQVGIAAKDKLKLIALAKMHGMDLLEDGVQRENSFLFLSWFLEEWKVLLCIVVKLGNYRKNYPNIYNIYIYCV